MTEEEIAATALEEEIRKSVLEELTLDTNVIGQMQANIERMEREETTNEPALDHRHIDNQGKTQYQIDKEILQEYSDAKSSLETEYKEFFPSDIEPV